MIFSRANSLLGIYPKNAGWNPIDAALPETWYYRMIKTIFQTGSSHGNIFDSALMTLAPCGRRAAAIVQDGGTIAITRARPMIKSMQASEKAKQPIRRNP